MTLAGFYRRRERWTEMESALRSGVSAAQRDKHAGVALYNGASVLTRANREPALAAKMLEEYLAGPAKTEEAPAFVAHTAAGATQAAAWRHRTAKRERAAALALAHDYRPAQEARTLERKSTCEDRTQSSRKTGRPFSSEWRLRLRLPLLPAQVSLATVVDLAQRNSSTVRLAEADVQKAQAALAQTQDVYLPNLVIRLQVRLPPSAFPPDNHPSAMRHHAVAGAAAILNSNTSARHAPVSRPLR